MTERGQNWLTPEKWEPFHEEFRRMREQTDKLVEGQGKLLTALEVAESACQACRRDVAGMSSVVYGNGSPGLKGNVASLMETRANMRWGFGLIWSALVAIVAAVISVWRGK